MEVALLDDNHETSCDGRCDSVHLFLTDDGDSLVAIEGSIRIRQLLFV